MATTADVIALARRVIKLQKKHYDEDNCDADNVAFEETALQLAMTALAVLDTPTTTKGRRR